MTKTKILLVEDDIETAETQKQILEEAGYEVMHAEDGASARAQFDEAPPDMVILDLMLPDTDGLVLLAGLKAMADVPVIVCSGTSRPRDQVLSKMLGADDFLPKPFDLDEFEKHVKDVFRRRREQVKPADYGSG